MDRDTVVALLAERLGERTDIDAAIILEMQIAQAFKMEQNGKFQPWFLITESAMSNCTIGEKRLATPSDFLMEVEEQGLWVTGLDGIEHELPKIGEGDLKARFKDAAQALPQRYAFSNDHFTLGPTPDQEYTVRMSYVASDAPLTSNIENNWLKYAADLMIALVGKQLASKKLHDKMLADEFNNDIAPAWDRLFAMHESRMHTNRSYSMGDGV